MMTISDISNQSQCGCKGVRFCALCESTDRVLKLRLEEDVYANYEYFVYDENSKNAVKCPSLRSSSTIDEIIQASLSAKYSDYPRLEIEGLTLVTDFLSGSEENYLMDMIDQVNWVQSQSGRRKQDYGPKVNFKQKKIKMDSFVGMPEYADMLLDKMRLISEEKLGNYQPFEMCNLEYEENKKSAIEMHQDDMWIWGNRLISVNLLSGSIMTLANEVSQQVCYVWMPHRSLLCMANSARYDWKHGVFSRHIRGRRIALTMREPAKEFQEGGDLYDKFGKELIRLGNIRVLLKNKS